MLNKVYLWFCLIAVTILFSTPVIKSAEASMASFTVAQGELAASAIFNQSGNNLIITLTNTSENDVTIPTQLLTGIFFTLANNPKLTTVSAIVPSGSSILFPVTGSGIDAGMDAGRVVGGEWAYKTDLSLAPRGASSGISSSGLGLFGPKDRFPGTNLQGPKDPDGEQYGITSAGDNPLTGNTPVAGNNALIKNSVVFTLSGLPSNYQLDKSISNVSFQYGTSLDGPNVHAPIPAAAWLLGSGLLGLIGIRRRIKA